ncbi:MinD/ParA family ATP-binding protein [Haloarcula pelagica]|uniref:MinD/ParA family ATP-binding protein n=1 Tax=Haloarcula pelagica TaxID=3033389 RepID=UPI0024C3CDDC|nr:P-loop NTPase [Halomicroarcula sp. YJ-61-S]
MTTVSNVYAVAGAKGGVGKTTTSINLGAALSAEGYDVAVVELDLAMANLVDFLDVDIDVTVATTLHDVLGAETAVEDATYPAVDGLDVVPSGTELDGYARTDLARLPAVVETLREQYDAVLMDTPAGLSEETLRPMQLADAVVLVSTPRVSSIRNADNTRELADRVETEVRGLVLTMSGTGSSPGADRIASFLDVDLLGHVPDDDAVPHAQDRGSPVVEDAPRSGAAVAYRKIARRLVGATSTAEPRPDTEPGPAATADRMGQRTDGGHVSKVAEETAQVADTDSVASGTTDESVPPTETTAPDRTGSDGSDDTVPDGRPNERMGDREDEPTAGREDEPTADRDGDASRSFGQKIRAVFGF